jgi:two-component system NtrC family sensor kinase
MGAPGPGRSRWQFGLAAKLASCLVASTVVFFSLFGFLNLRLERRQFEQMVLLSAERISDILQSGTRHQMLRNDRAALYEQIRDIGHEPGIDRVRIFNKEGLISFSSDPKEVGTMVNKQAEACYVCHAQQAPLTRLSRPDRARTFQGRMGDRVLAVIRPIENRPDCSSASCHAHPAGVRILGVIDAHLSLAAVDEQLAQHQRQYLLFAGLAIVLTSVFSALFVWLVIHRPIKELAAGTEMLAAGDLSHRLPVRSQDELGALAESFNKMTEDLSAAHSELTESARTLEQRVKRKTSELEQAYNSLLANEKLASVGKLAATVAHEVNNPLFGMLTYARLTLKALHRVEIDPAEKAKMIENLSVIERESRRCGDIMKNLLTFARQSPPQRAPNDLNLLLERAVSLVRHQYELQEIELERRLTPGLAPVFCDQGQIQQVLLILLVNAAEAMPNGGSVVVTTAENAPEATAVARVRDTGVGISPEDIAKIFDPFFTTKENQHRTGLGLAIARSIVENHGGKISVASSPGEGAEFVVTLPLAPVPAPVSAGSGKREERT